MTAKPWPDEARTAAIKVHADARNVPFPNSKDERAVDAVLAALAPHVAMPRTPPGETAESVVEKALRDASAQLATGLNNEYVPALATAIAAALDRHLVSGHNPDIDLDALAGACERFLEVHRDVTFLEVHRDVTASRTVFGPAVTHLKHVLTDG